MKIIVTSVMVANQAKALKFYTKVLGFEKKTDLPAGKYRWLTVVSPEARDGVELVLEPAALKETRTYQKALFKMGIPATVFGVDDIAKELIAALSPALLYSPGLAPGILRAARTAPLLWG